MGVLETCEKGADVLVRIKDRRHLACYSVVGTIRTGREVPLTI